MREHDTPNQIKTLRSGMERKRSRHCQLIADNGLSSGARA